MSLWDEILATNAEAQRAQQSQDANNASNVSADDLIFYPRASVGLSVTVEGTDEYDTSVIPVKASVSVKPHTQASEASVTVMGSALPFDPRQVAGMLMTVYLAAVDAVDGDATDTANRRFVGFVDEMETRRGEKSVQVELKARDLSAIFRDFHPLPASAIPSYSDTLQDAINGILSATTGAQGRVTIQSNDLISRSLTSAVPDRSQSRKVQLPANTSAWQAIEHVCGLLALAVRMELDQIVVYEPQTTFNDQGQTTISFVFGGTSANLLDVETTKKFIRNRKGIRATAYNPTTRAILIADYPADADALPTRRPPSHIGGSTIRTRRQGSRRGGNSAGNSSSGSSTSDSSSTVERDVLNAPQGIQTQDALNSFAQRLYTERSKQEIEGKITCPIWTPDILGMKYADRVDIQIDPDLSAELKNTTDFDAAVQLVMDRLDLTQDAANALLKASWHTPTAHWYVRTATHEFDSEGVCQTVVEFLNLIQVEPTGSDSQSTGASQGAQNGSQTNSQSSAGSGASQGASQGGSAGQQIFR